MATSSSHLSSVFAHGHHSNLTPSIVRSSSAGILSSDMISYPGVPAQANHCADPLSGVQYSNDSGNVQRQQISGSVRGPNELDDNDELLCLVNENLDVIIANDITVNVLQMAGPVPVPVSLSRSYENCLPMTHQSVPSNSQQLCPTISPPPTTNVISPKKTKARRQWNLELHDRFIDAVKQLGGSEKATPKAILGIMKVEGLTRDQVKSHLQKYKLAQAKHHPSEGTSAETTMPTEVVQIIEAFALRVQMELQKKLHDMVDKTHRDLVKIHSRVLELENRQNLLMNRTSHLSSPAAALASSSAVLPEDRSREAHVDGNSDDATVDAAAGHESPTVAPQRSPEAGSPGDAEP